jgi:hypothetical protein
MKPQLVSYHGGYHNEDLPKTTARIMEGGSWKKQRVIVIVPSAATMPTKVAMAHWSLAFPPNQAAHRMLALGMEVGDAYSSAIESILAHPDLSQWEYILTIEADNMPPFDGLVKLLDDMEKHPEYACIGGLYFCKGPGGCAHIWGDVRDPVVNFRPQPPDPNGGLVECCGTSMGFNLWRMSMFKDTRLRRPWFKTLNGSEGQGIGTQDLYFWGDARKYGYRCAVDCSVKVGHHDHEGKFGPPDFTW